MLRFIVRRLIITIPTILVVITITWGLIRLAPGNFYISEKAIPAAIEKNIREKYGLDKPWYEQYGHTIWNIVRHFDFGTSLKYEGQSVNSIIARSLPVSATVGILAYLLALVVGITAGSIAALKPNSKRDYASMALAMLGISIPNFVLGPILILVFSLTLYWFPPWINRCANRSASRREHGRASATRAPVCSRFFGLTTFALPARKD